MWGANFARAIGATIVALVAVACGLGMAFGLSAAYVVPWVWAHLSVGWH